MCGPRKALRRSSSRGRMRMGWVRNSDHARTFMPFSARCVPPKKLLSDFWYFASTTRPAPYRRIWRHGEISQHAQPPRDSRAPVASLSVVPGFLLQTSYPGVRRISPKPPSLTAQRPRSRTWKRAGRIFVHGKRVCTHHMHTSTHTPPGASPWDGVLGGRRRD